MRLAKRWCILAVTVLLGVLLLANSGEVAAGVTITKCKMADKHSGGETTSGFADAFLSVSFIGEANCTCEQPNLVYTWYFGDGTSASGASVSHVYGASGAGNRSPSLSVTCSFCSSNATQGGLSVSAIKAITVTKIGDITNPTNNGRLCFDGNRSVTAVAEPTGVSGSNKIDWYLVVTANALSKANLASGDLGALPQWPLSNSLWGANTLYISIDGSLVPGQQGELNLTGDLSYVSSDKSIKVFFDETGPQNPGGTTPNWFYYWKQTSAYYGTMNYDSAAGSGKTDFVAGAWRCYILSGGHLSALGGCWNNASGIDFFANLCRHESQHQSDHIADWGADHGRDPTKDTDGDMLPDNLEANLVSGHPYDNTKAGTYDDTFGYLPPPGGKLRDDEDYCLRREPSWTNGSANSVDWAHPGKQWP